MASLNSSVDFNHGGCASGHRPSGTLADRALMQEYRVSGATQPSKEHVTDRLIHRIPGDDHAQNIKAQVDTISAVLSPENTGPNNGT